MSQSKFTSANVPALEAVGRVNEGGRKLPLVLDIENDRVLTIANADGFRLTVRFADVMNRVGLASRLRMRVYSSNVECVLADGTIILLEGNIDPADGRLRLDAVDQRNFPGFWVEVRRNFRRAV